MTAFGGEGGLVAPVVHWSPKRLWDEHHNALTVWEVIDSCLQAKPRKRIPAWCLEYVGRVAAGLVAIEKLDDPSSDAERSAVWAALGFGGQGEKSPYVKLVELRGSVQDAFASEEQVIDKQFERDRRAERQSKPHRITPERARRRKRTAKHRWDV
jgi:hypothetical protein